MSGIARRDLRPEQLRALAYLRRKGTEAPKGQLRQHVAATFEALEKQLDGVPEAAREEAPGPGRWSVHEILDHLVVSHRPTVDQLRSLLAGAVPDTPAVPASLQSDQPLERPWSELRARLAAAHLSLLEQLDQAPADASLEVTAPVVMVVKAAEGEGDPEPLSWEERLDWKAFVQALRCHVVEHMAQIARTVEAVS